MLHADTKGLLEYSHNFFFFFFFLAFLLPGINYRMNVVVFFCFFFFQSYIIYILLLISSQCFCFLTKYDSFSVGNIAILLCEFIFSLAYVFFFIRKWAKNDHKMWTSIAYVTNDPTTQCTCFLPFTTAATVYKHSSTRTLLTKIRLYV